MTGGAGYIRMPPAVRESLTGWVNDGACKGMGPDFFFGEDEEHVHLDECRKVCDGCKVAAECLEHAIKWERYGVWAGTTEPQRERIRRQRRFKRMVGIGFDA